MAKIYSQNVGFKGPPVCTAQKGENTYLEQITGCAVAPAPGAELAASARATHGICANPKSFFRGGTPLVKFGIADFTAFIC